MSAVDLAVARLKVDEGFRAMAYLDTTGHRTIGYGTNLDAGITQAAAAALLQAQAQEIGDSIAEFSWYPQDDARRSVLIELAFNLGTAGLLHFPIMLTAIGRMNWQSARDALLNSDAARMLPGRYNKLAQILLTGVA